jgi:hypothetical protein
VPHTALGSNHNNLSAQTSITLTTTATVPAGDTIIVGTGAFNSPNRTMAITGGGLTWTNDKSAANGGDFAAIHSGPAPAGLASGTVLTCTFSAGCTGPVIAAASFPNFQSTPPDTSSSATPAAAAAWAATAINTTVTDTVVGLAWGDTPSTSSTPTAPWVEAFDTTDAGSGEELTLVYQESVASGSYAPAGTWGGSPAGQIIHAVAYKVSATAASPAPRTFNAIPFIGGGL